MSLITERKLSPIPLTSEQVRCTLWSGMFLHGSTFICGLVGSVLMDIMGHERESLLQSIEVENPSHSCAALMKYSMILMMGCGLTGIVSQFMSYPKISAFVLPIIVGLPWGLAVLSLIEAVSIDIREHQEDMTKSLLRESYNIKHFDWIRAVYQYDQEWDVELQNLLECCGVADGRDWFHSTCNCMPPSCCKDSVRQQCENDFLKVVGSGTAYRELGPDPQNYRNIEDSIQRDNCVLKLQTIFSHIRSTWINFALWFVCIQFWLVFLVAYLCFLIQELNETERGTSQLEEYRWSLPIRKRVPKDQLKSTYASLRNLKSAKVITTQYKNAIYHDFVVIKPPPRVT
ncbi:Tetraspanin-6 [Orchesella cincta]|uniref:Tetraspanin-6 n=1 Tax=Orchesella cincta TaxID=48709 RepID=A0A1D2N759_ORCCI|nr:Tetraspanin-6 [Orchesella cincta]